ncbi:hypothetical protein RKE29_26300 [Streptomyces sp. B1866]|uniref:hypothetical protein n=1 Tax=Streptomyces sp. B1866 TaxID=3075431 RepID=UPI002890E754|nr:hypothetical protein [Streptomyces sp. B1866]MDT3400096.1 hypothetical protein [Streptomyces sp. B1866]
MSATGGRPRAEEPRLTIDRRASSLRTRRRFLLSAAVLLALLLTSTAALAVSGNVLLPFERIVTLEGRMGSKSEFFEDRQVRRILMRHHIQVHVTTSGSREVAVGDLEPYDFVFPSGQPAGDLITADRRERRQYAQVYRPFVSPIALATYREYAETLRDAGVATAQPAGPGGGPALYYTLDMNRFLRLVDGGRRWNDLGIRRHGAANGNMVLAQTSNICGSNSAGTYLGLVAFTRNDGRVPDSPRAADRLASEIKPLLVGQGMPSADVFQPYTSPEGKDIAPVVVAYEHQYLAYQAYRRAHGKEVDTERVLLYPSTQFVTQPQFIALNRRADRLGELITQDRALRERAMKLGFRVLDPAGAVDSDQLSGFLSERDIPVPADDADDTRTAMPSLRLLERMISVIGDCPPAVLRPGTDDGEDDGTDDGTADGTDGGTARTGGPG